MSGRTRLSRQCYSKFWRCPGWAGGGFRMPRRDRCRSGSLLVPGIRTAEAVVTGASVYMPEDRWWAWKFHRCNRGCGVLALPYVTRWADPTWWWHCARYLPGSLADRMRERRALRKWKRRHTA